MSAQRTMKKYDFQFTKYFNKAFAVSGVLVLCSLILLFTKGLHYGVDFEGGAEIQLKFDKGIDVVALRKTLKKTVKGGAQVQSIGDDGANEYLLKVKAEEGELNKVTESIMETVERDFGQAGVSLQKTDIVGPKAGRELRISGFQAMAYAILAIMIYIGLRFDFKYSPGAIVALVHDILIILGIFVLTQKQFSLQIVASLLAVIGYSVNDTVVVFDRVREKEEEMGESAGLPKIISRAINETLSRTVLTSSTTLFVSLAMLFFGGPSIKDFFFAITIGVVVGTYSSIFVAGPSVIYLDKLYSRKKA